MDESGEKTPESEEQPMKSTKWTVEEDTSMVSLVEQFGTRNWGLIGSKLSEIVMKRTGKQCRERWHNQLDPSITKAIWTCEEEEKLLEVPLN